MFEEKTGSRYLNVRMTLRDVLYISYAVPAGRMRSIIPDTLPLATVNDDVALISIVVLKSTHVRVNLLPFARFKYYQLNIRTYVKDPVSGENAVYFINSGVTSRLISLVTRMSGIPWQLTKLAVQVNLQGANSSYIVDGNWRGNLHLKSQSPADGSGKPPFFENKKSAVDFLIRPLIGFIEDHHRLKRFTIRHPVVNPESWRLTEFNFPLFTNLNVVEDPTNPHSVFFLPAVDFSIFLPPKEIKNSRG